MGDGGNAGAGLASSQSLFGAVKKNVTPGSEGSAQSLRFAPQWTAPEMLSTPMGLSLLLDAFVTVLMRVVRNIKCGLGYIQVREILSSLHAHQFIFLQSGCRVLGNIP